MGKHFDGLVDLLKEPIPQSSFSREMIDINMHLGQCVDEFTLFEFPLRKQEILNIKLRLQIEYKSYYMLCRVKFNSACSV